MPYNGRQVRRRLLTKLLPVATTGAIQLLARFIYSELFKKVLRPFINLLSLQ